MEPVASAAGDRLALVGDLEGIEVVKDVAKVQLDPLMQE